MSTHNICLCGKIRKNIIFLAEKSDSSGVWVFFMYINFSSIIKQVLEMSNLEVFIWLSV